MVHSGYINMDKLFSHLRIIIYQWFLELLLWKCVYFYSIYDEPFGFLQQLVNTHLQNGCFGTHNPLHYTFRRLFLHLISIQTILKRLQDKFVILLFISTLKLSLCKIWTAQFQMYFPSHRIFCEIKWILLIPCRLLQ